jgi:hypothetical protein
MWRVIFFLGMYGFLVGFICAQIVHAIRSHARIGWTSSIDFRPKKPFVWLEGGVAKSVLAVVGIGLIAFGWYKGEARAWGGGVFILATALTYWFCIKRRAVRFW